MTVRRPGAADDPDGTDLLQPSKDYLYGLRLLPEGEAADSVDSVDVITSNTLEITTQVKKLITWGGAGGAGASVVAAVVGGFNNWPESVRVTLLAGAALILASAVYGLARVMDGDVRGRAAVTVAQLEARTQVTDSLLTSFSTAKTAQRADEPERGEEERSRRPNRSCWHSRPTNRFTCRPVLEPPR